MMKGIKKTMTYVFAAVAVAMALVSCTKEITTGNEGNKDINADGTRTLTVSFAGVTKTTPTIVNNEDGTTSIQPVWTAGDEILLADGTSTEKYTVKENQAGQSSITISTTLQNSVTAVYPADAAETSGNSITGVKVLAEQDSTFATANICMAEETTGALAFQNATAVFKVKVPAHTTRLVVTSLGEIDEKTGQRGETVRPINTEGADAAAKQVITVPVDDNEYSTTCYVAVLVDETNPVLLANLNFDAVTSETAGSQGGFSPNFLTAVKGIVEPYALKVNKNTVYTVDPSFLHEYIALTLPVMIWDDSAYDGDGGYVQDGDKTITEKWATMNVGATAETEEGSYGLYFMWGDVVGQKPSGNAFSFPATKYYPADNFNEWSQNSGFYWANCPYTDGIFTFENWNTAVFTKYTDDKESAKGGEPDNKTRLDLKDDAAFANWGGAWRMPDKDEFDNLITSTETEKSDISNGVLTIKGTSLKFPSAGCGEGLDLFVEISYGMYWSSSLYGNDNWYAHHLVFYVDTGERPVPMLSYYYRYAGGSIRPISE